MSEHKSLLVALAAFQAEAPALKKDAINPAFRSKYVSLDSIVETTRPLLAKHGLLWSTFPSQDEHGKPSLKYEISHPASGETKAGEMPLLLAKNDPQGQGSALTYARRYSVCAVLNLVADEDDDGNGASGGKTTQQKTNGRSKPASPKVDKARAEQLAETAFTVGVQDKLQLAASHVVGGDIGDCSTREAAAKALSGLSVEQADRVEAWIDRKLEEIAAKETAPAEENGR